MCSDVHVLTRNNSYSLIWRSYETRSLKEEFGVPEKVDITCDRPGGSVVDESPTEVPQSETAPVEEEAMIKVGQKAPDFTAPAFTNDGFGQVQLSEYLGQWVALCFYPGDFTFV